VTEDAVDHLERIAAAIEGVADLSATPLAPLTPPLPGSNQGAVGHGRISARLISREGPRRKPTHAPSSAARPLATPIPKDAPVAATGARRGRIRAKIHRYLSTVFARARRTRPTFLHIGPAPNPSSVSRGCAHDTAL
jgi:hypothetical protein